MESMKEEISLVDLIERERAALGTNQTRVTLETFLAWKKRKIQEKKQRELDEEERKRKDFKAGRQMGLSGREMFSFNPDLVDFGIDDGEEAIESYGRNEDDDDATEYKELDLSMLSLSIKEVDSKQHPHMCFRVTQFICYRWITLERLPRRIDGRKCKRTNRRKMMRLKMVLQLQEVQLMPRQSMRICSLKKTSKV